MNKSYFLSLIFLLLLFCLQLSAQDVARVEPLLKGQLIDAEGQTPISFAHITNLQRGLRTISDSSGFFNLPASTGDTLLISSVTYGQHKVAVPPKSEKRFRIELLPNVYELEEVVIQSLPSERKFKEMLLGMDSPEKEDKLDLNLPAELPLAPASGDGAVGVSFGGGISGLAGKFSKKERGRRFAAEMKVREEREVYIHTKFNRDIVQHVTGLEDDEKLDAFMKYCVLSEDFLYKASDYEIHQAVLGCFGDFIKEQEG
jgi:hypothetical protein